MERQRSCQFDGTDSDLKAYDVARRATQRVATPGPWDERGLRTVIGELAGMRGYIESWGRAAPELVPLTQQRTLIGRAEASDVRLVDTTVSDLHAIVESYGRSFALRDLGSMNGTFVNGVRLVTERRLRGGDEIRLGEARLYFRSEGADDCSSTDASDGPPELTRRERDVLLALCRPMVSAKAFTQPAGIRQLARDLIVSEAAVKFHLANLYDKFGIYDSDESRRVQLANEAIRRRAVTYADLRESRVTADRLPDRG